MTGPKNNAVRAAKSYLSLTAFSRNRFIQQLSSDAGDGHEISDGTVAMDSLNIDGNQ
ncbi:Ltp family lipoprotein [Pantoea dispersa]|uniref:Ltp family lipoprotein n=1 Tax=Pantoea dispersa TaxID=59814 RepID=UPI001C65C5C5